MKEETRNTIVAGVVAGLFVIAGALDIAPAIKQEIFISDQNIEDAKSEIPAIEEHTKPIEQVDIKKPATKFKDKAEQQVYLDKFIDKAKSSTDKESDRYNFVTCRPIHELLPGTVYNTDNPNLQNCNE